MFTIVWGLHVTFVSMKKNTVLYIFLFVFAIGGISACKAKHCATFDDSMEGFNPKKVKTKKGRQEGLFDAKVKR